MYQKLRIKRIKSFFIVSVAIATIICFSGCNQEKQGTYETEMLSVYLEDNISQEQLDKIEVELKSIDGVKSVKYVSKKDALELAKDKLGEGNEHLLDQYTETNHPFPACYEVSIKKQEEYGKIVDKIKKYDGVKEVKAPRTN